MNNRTTNIFVAIAAALVVAWVALDAIMVAHLGRPIRKVRAVNTLFAGRVISSAC